MIKLYTERATGIINKEASALNKGDKLVVTEIRYTEGRKVVILEVSEKDGERIPIHRPRHHGEDTVE